jgi:TetR/AcrR family transcriptional repressor of bet genes
LAVTGIDVERPKRTESREVRRRQLIEATISSIAELGFSDTTLTSVTERAGLSHGTINFHFKSKETLFTETLGFIAQEHYDLWCLAMKNAGPSASNQLAAIIDVDFRENVCSLEKLSVWFAFWGQVKHRPAYLNVHDGHDVQRSGELKRLCGEIICEGGYDHIDADAAARRIEALVDGLWLNMLLYPSENRRIEARDDAFDFLAGIFPKHFSPTTYASGRSNRLPMRGPDEG